MKPMLASDLDPRFPLSYPFYASFKLDGVRAIVKDGVVLSRSLKPIRNKHVQTLFAHLEGYDGELIVGSPCAEDVFQRTTSGVMSVEGTPDVTFFVFDRWDLPTKTFEERLSCLNVDTSVPSVYVLSQTLVLDLTQLDDLERSAIAQGYEGLILRSRFAPYKYGRSTAREGYLLKVKRFLDAEAEIVGFTERMHNENEAETNELGRTQRSECAENLVPAGDLGSLTCSLDGVIFAIGTGFSSAQRLSLWSERETLIGQLAKFKYFPVGVKVAPRFPVFLGLRHKDDM